MLFFFRNTNPWHDLCWTHGTICPWPESTAAGSICVRPALKTVPHFNRTDASYRQQFQNRITQQEVTAIRKMAPIHVIVYYPGTEAGKEALARRVSDVHAAAVNQRLKSLNCPTSQKLALLDAVIETKKKENREQDLGQSSV